MSQQIKLPFKVQMDASISQLLLGQGPKVNFNKQLPFAINKLYKQKLRVYFRKIKNRQVNNSVEGLFSRLVQSVKTQKKQQKVSYLHYAVQQLPTQPQVPKTIIFNLRVKSLKQSVFLKIKQHSLQTKQQQLTTILINRQSQLLNHLIPKIQQKILSYGLRKIIEYSKQQKGRFMIVKLLDRFGKLMIKRIGYSEFFNRGKRLRERESKLKLGVRKIGKIFRLCTKLFLEQTFRQLELYTQGNKLQQAITQKKLLISQVYTKNTQRMATVQQQRETLRNLKYKLDQQAVQRSHVLTERKRTLMLMKTKFTQQSKVLGDQISVIGGEVMRLDKIVQKQQSVVQILQGIRKSVNQSTTKGIRYEQTVVSIYKQLTQLYQQDQDSNINSNITQLYQQIKHIVEDIITAQQQQQQQQQKVLKQVTIPTLQSIEKTRDYQCMRIELLEMIVRSIQVNKGKQQLKQGQNSPIGIKQSAYSQQYVPTSRSLVQSKYTAGGANVNSASTVLMNTSSSINTSVVSGSPSTNKISKSLFSTTNTFPQPIQFTKAKQQHFLIEQTISLVLKKKYQLQMRHAIKKQLEQLSELLIEDSKEH